MEIKLFDSELKVMDVLWKEGDTTAKQIAEIKTVGWSKTTTYTLSRVVLTRAVKTNGRTLYPLVTIEQARE